MTDEKIQDSCVTEQLFTSKKRDHGLMGPAHAASGAGFGLLILGLLSDPLSDFVSSENYLLAVLKIVITVVGAALIVDLDNTRSTVKSQLGIVGSALSGVFRFSSRAIQTIVRTKRDDASPDPHRGFWHTIVGAATLGAIVYGFSLITVEVTLPIVDQVVTWGTISAFVFSTLLFHLTLAGIAGKSMAKLKKTPIIGEVFSFLISAIVIGLLFAFSPNDDYKWLGFSVFLGATLHIIGDALTRAGVPIFFPIIGLIKGKMWWKTRFAHFEAKSEGLNKTVIILSIIAGIVGIVFLANSTLFAT